MSSTGPDRSEPPSADEQAAQWLARRDRGLRAAEQDDYLQWLRENPRHASIIAQHEEALRRLERLADCRPAAGSEPDPDLFASRNRGLRIPLAALAAAAALAFVFLVWRHEASPSAADVGRKSFLRVSEIQALPDGSLVELRAGSRLSTRFTASERRVRLLSGGEALFTVAKNPSRPFIVEAGNIAVRAVGTAFDVRVDSASVDVLVTEGKVWIERASDARPSPVPRPTAAAGQCATIALDSSAPDPRVIDLTQADIEVALAWKAPRLQFFETPLRDAVAEMNRHNRLKLVLGDPALGSVPVGGTFRVGNVDGFVRLLEITMGVRAERRSDFEIVLTRPR